MAIVTGGDELYTVWDVVVIVHNCLILVHLVSSKSVTVHVFYCILDPKRSLHFSPSLRIKTWLETALFWWNVVGISLLVDHFLMHFCMRTCLDDYDWLCRICRMCRMFRMFRMCRYAECLTVLFKYQADGKLL